MRLQLLHYFAKLLRSSSLRASPMGPPCVTSCAGVSSATLRTYMRQKSLAHLAISAWPI
jgi:hypothetical protein